MAETVHLLEEFRLTSASNGAVCSLRPSPPSKPNRGMLPPAFFASMRLTTARSWYWTSCFRFSTSGGASDRLRDLFKLGNPKD